MASRGQMTGMQGVFLVAAELSARGLVVSTTSRNAMGADLLVTDAECKRTWSVQVKTNRKSAGFWLVGEKATRLGSPSHVYVLVNLRPKDGKHEYYVLRSREFKARVKTAHLENSTWYAVYRSGIAKAKDRWGVFGPIVAAEATRSRRARAQPVMRSVEVMELRKMARRTRV